MKQFLKDFWLWILVPVVLVILAVVGLWLVAGDPITGLDYAIMGG